MDPMRMEPKKEEQKIRKGFTHYLLTNSYMAYLFAIITGIILDTIFPIKIFGGQEYQYFGFSLIVISSVLIYWAQRTTNKTKKQIVDGKRNFDRGPYKYSRNPTYLGLLLATLGFGLMIGSFFIFVIVIVIFFINKLIFLPREERLLERIYGQNYLDYKKKVRTWI